MDRSQDREQVKHFLAFYSTLKEIYIYIYVQTADRTNLEKVEAFML